MSFQTTPSYQRVEELDGRLADTLLQWGLSLADTKHRLGRRTSEWVNGGPALEAAVGASALTQDELGHARSLYAILKDFPGAPAGLGAENDLEARADYFCPHRLDDPWPSWLDVIAANVLLDRATRLAVAAAAESAYLPLRGRTAKILQEEAFHRIFGDSWLAKLARLSPEMKGKLQAALDHFWLTAVAWLGPDEDAVVLTLVENGILSATPAQLRHAWLAEVTALLARHELDVPDQRPDWSAWSSRTREVT